MRNTFSQEQLERCAAQHGDAFAASIADADLTQLAARVPASWLALVAQPDAVRIRQLWASAAERLPRFVDYLARSIEGAAIVEDRGVLALLVALPDWREDASGLQPGFCCMGTPASRERIDGVIAEVGPVPDALVRLWQVANFITLKDRSILCSPEPSSWSLTEPPRIYSALADPGSPDAQYECLQVAVVNHQMVTCMTRRPTQTRWDDSLVLRFRQIDELSSAVRIHLDDKLADWTFVDYEPKVG